MRRLVSLLGAIAIIGTAIPAQAGDYYRRGYGGYGGYGYRQHYVPARPVYGYGRPAYGYGRPVYGYGYRRHNNGAAAAAGIGLLFGVLAGAAIASQPQAPAYAPAPAYDPYYGY